MEHFFFFLINLYVGGVLPLIVYFLFTSMEVCYLHGQSNKYAGYGCKGLPYAPLGI